MLGRCLISIHDCWPSSCHALCSVTIRAGSALYVSREETATGLDPETHISYSFQQERQRCVTPRDTARQSKNVKPVPGCATEITLCSAMTLKSLIIKIKLKQIY